MLRFLQAVFKIKTVLSVVFSLTGLFAAVFYFGLQSAHGFQHKDEHGIVLESDSCHRTVFHAEKACEHPRHFSEIQSEKKFPALLRFSDAVFSGNFPSILAYRFFVEKTACKKLFFSKTEKIPLSSRGPPEV